MFIYHPTDLLLMILYVVIPDYFFKTILLATSRYNEGAFAHFYLQKASNWLVHAFYLSRIIFFNLFNLQLIYRLMTRNIEFIISSAHKHVHVHIFMCTFTFISHSFYV